jgi:hypothetical protein
MRGVTFEQPRSMVRPRGEKEGQRGGGGPAAGVPRGAVVGPGPDRQAVPGSCPRPAGMRDVHRAVVADRTEERRRGADRWAAAQCWAAVPLIGGSGLACQRRVGERAAHTGARGPAREEKKWAKPR